MSKDAKKGLQDSLATSKGKEKLEESRQEDSESFVQAPEELGKGVPEKWVQTKAGEQSPDWRDREHYLYYNHDSKVSKTEPMGLYRDTLLYADPYEGSYAGGLHHYQEARNTYEISIKENNRDDSKLGSIFTHEIALYETLLEKDRQEAINAIHEVITAPAREKGFPHDDGENEQVIAMKAWLTEINSSKDTMYFLDTYLIPESLQGLYTPEQREQLGQLVETLEAQNSRVSKKEELSDKAKAEVIDIAYKKGTPDAEKLQAMDEVVSKLTENYGVERIPEAEDTKEILKFGSASVPVLDADASRKERIANAEVIRDDRTFSREVEQDKRILQQTLCRPDDLLRHYVGSDMDKASKGMALDPIKRDNLVKQLSPEQLEEYNKEKDTADILKRLYYVQATVGMTVVTKDGRVDASENGLPGASYAMMGNRVVMDVDDEVGLQLANYVLTGSTEVAEEATPKDLIQGTPVFQRTLATHGLERRDGELIETKGYGAGIKARGNHFGLNVAFGPYGEPDAQGRTTTTDGRSGHLYWQIGKDGRMLAGVEPCRDPSIGELFSGGTKGQYGTHFLGGSDKTGASGTRVGGIRVGKNGEMELSPRDLRLQQEKEVYAEKQKEGILEKDYPYAQTKGPMRYNGLKMKVSEEQLKSLSETSANDIPVDIGSYVPAPIKNDNAQQPVKHTAKPEAIDKKTLNEECAKKQAEHDTKKAEEKHARKENSRWNRFKHWVKEKLGIVSPREEEHREMKFGDPTNSQKATPEEVRAKLEALQTGVSKPFNVSHPFGTRTAEELIASQGSAPKDVSAPLSVTHVGTEGAIEKATGTVQVQEEDRRDHSQLGEAARDAAQKAKEKGGDPVAVGKTVKAVGETMEGSGVTKVEPGKSQYSKPLPPTPTPSTVKDGQKGTDTNRDRSGSFGIH